MKDFRTLKVWQRAHELVLENYRCSRSFPAEERFGLTSQLRRSAVSIPSNIAEGCGRGSDSDFGRFLQIAMGSASEVEYQTMLARDLGLLDEPRCDGLLDRVQQIKRMLAGLLQRVRPPTR